MSNVSADSIVKMGHCENITTNVLLQTCEALDCNIEDIKKRIPVQQDRETNTYAETRKLVNTERGARIS